MSLIVNRESACRCSSVVEHFLGKEEVDSSILFNGSIVSAVVEKEANSSLPAEAAAQNGSQSTSSG